MAAISAAAISAGLSDEATRLEEFEMSEVEGTPVRRLSSAEGQLRDESDSLALPATSPSPAPSPTIHSHPLHRSSTFSPAVSPATNSNRFPVSTPSRFGVLSPMRRGISFAATSAAARSRQVLLRFKNFAKRWLWRERKLSQGRANHQMWWLISGTTRTLKRLESQKSLTGQAGGTQSSDQFMPISGCAAVNRVPWYIIDPQGTFAVVWTLIMTILLLYCAITIPYFIAFTQSDAFRWADVAVDCMFFLDIIASFATAHVKYDDELDYQLEISPRVLAKRYLRGWFILDVLGTVPFTEIMRDSVQGADAYPRVIKIIRVLRLLKLLRLSRFGKKAGFIKSLLKVHVVVFKCFKFLFFFGLLAHLMANILVMTAVFASDEHPKPQNWMTDSRAILMEGVGLVPISDSSEGTRYLMALYWSFTTIITVGYGDIYPVQTAEAGVCLLNMIIGACMVSFIVGNVASILAAADSSGGMDTIVAELSYKYKLSNELQGKLKRWLQSLKEATGDMTPHWPDSLGMLSKDVRRQMVHLIAGTALLSSHFFPDNKQLYQVLYQLMKRHVFLAHDVIYRHGDACKRIYFIVEGSVDIRLPDCGHSLLTLGKGAHFADSAVVSQEQLMRYDVAASQVTVCVSLSFEDIKKAMKANNCPIALMKTQALQHDELLVRCLRASKKIFESRCAPSSPESSESNERLQKLQAKLQYLSSQLFQPMLHVDHDTAPRRRASFASEERSAMMLQTGKLVSLLDSCKEDEGGRIAVLEAARKQVTHFIRVYEDMILDSERAP